MDNVNFAAGERKNDVRVPIFGIYNSYVSYENKYDGYLGLAPYTDTILPGTKENNLMYMLKN